MWYYLLQASLLQLVFLAFYDLFLQKLPRYQWNRLYLLTTAVLALLLPFVKFNLTSNYALHQSLEPVIIGSSKLQTQLTTEPALSHQYLFTVIYFTGVMLMILLLVYKLNKIYNLVKTGKQLHKDGYTFILTEGNNQAFSFYKYIFMNRQLFESQSDAIIRHELVHIRQKHWLDLLIFEILKILFWFNPLMWLYQKRLSLIHEFIADRQVLQQTDFKSYFNRLLQARFNVQNISFINQIYKPSQIKKRIMMQKKHPNQTKALVRYLGFGLLLISLTLVIDACNSGKSGNEQIDLNSVKDTVIHLKNGKTVNIYVVDQNDDSDKEVAFQFLNNPPVYPGCEGKEGKALKDCMSKKIQTFVARNFNTGIADSLKLNGQKVKILTMFTFDKNGQVTNIRARSKYKALEEEAKRVIALIPKVRPGKQKGKTVKVTYTLPIIFKVETEDHIVEDKK